MQHMVRRLVCLAAVAGLSFGVFGATYYVKPAASGAGDPAVKCTEPKPNGWRVNLGAYGNTPWATMSKSGSVLIVR